MDIFRRSNAPIGTEAWIEIEKNVRQALTARMTGRRIADLDGPHGLEFAAVNLGKLTSAKEADGVNYALRKVQPLIEVRVPFELSIWSLDNIARGSEEINLEPAMHAALKIVDFEEAAIYNGFADAGIQGLLSAQAHEPLTLGSQPSEIPHMVAAAVQRLLSAGVAGPYALVLPQDRLSALIADSSTYPPVKRVASLLQDGPLLGTAGPAAAHGFVISLRGGDLKLTVGQDLTLGYDYHDATKVKLYLTESFTFRLIDEDAVVVLNP